MNVRIRFLESEVTGLVGWVDASKIDALADFLAHTNAYDCEGDPAVYATDVQVVVEGGEAFCEIVLG